MLPLSITHQLIPSHGMTGLINHESSKNFSKSPNSSSSSIASTSGNSSYSSSLSYENQQQKAINGIYVDVNNFSSVKKYQQNQFLDKFYQSLQAIDENNYKSTKYRLERQELFREKKLDGDISSLAMLQHQQNQLAASLTQPFNNAALLNNPFLQSYYINLASKGNIAFSNNLHADQMKSNDLDKGNFLNDNPSFSLKRRKISDRRANDEAIESVESKNEIVSIPKNCSPVRNK